MTITTKYQTNAQGRSQILVKGEGKQLTVSFDPSKSSDWNHGNAAGDFLLTKVPSLAAVLIVHPQSRPITHTASDDGVIHKFKVEA